MGKFINWDAPIMSLHFPDKMNISVTFISHKQSISDYLVRSFAQRFIRLIKWTLRHTNTVKFKLDVCILCNLDDSAKLKLSQSQVSVSVGREVVVAVRSHGEPTNNIRK
ncbi:hypothetical protein YC2023_014096 [Brassica napus]